MKNIIPDKLFFKISEVSKISGVEPHVLRYWESEFDGLCPQKNDTGQRVYRKKDIENVFKIRKLLHEERYSIEGARKRLNKKARFNDKHDKVLLALKEIKEELQNLSGML